jgi:hypothetical protein
MKNNIPHIIRCIILIFFVSSTISCQDKEIQKKEAFLKSVVENCLGKKLLIPNGMSTYAPFPDYISDSAQLSNAKFKIYSHINASCPTCVRDIRLWNNIAIDFEKYKVPVILICESDDDFELFKYILETGEIKKFSYPFFLDVNRVFSKHNKFMKESPHFETILTDRENNILLLGNPIRSKEMKDLYMKIIKEQTDQKSADSK